MKLPDLSTTELAANKAAEALIARREQQVMAIMSQALNDTRATMSKVYERYAKNGVLSRADMTQYNRMVTLEKNLMDTLGPVISKTKSIANRVSVEAYNESFFQHAWAVDSSQGIRLSWGTLNEDAIRANLDNPLTKISLEKYGPDARAAVKSAVSRGLPIGKSYVNMAADLKKALETTTYKALRIIRTEGQTAMNAGSDAAYARAEEKGVEGRYIWDATLDGRTRPSHQRMDQKVRDEQTERFEGPNGQSARYPADENLSAAERIQCRCRLRFEVEGYAPLLRRSREDGLVPYQSYEDWSKSRTGSIPKPKRIPTTQFDRSKAILAEQEYTQARQQAYATYLANVKASETPEAAMEAFGSSLTKVQSNIGGSTGAYVATDPSGKKWVVKQYANATSPKASITNELLASRLYTELGIKVPESRMAIINGKPAFVTRMLDGVELGQISGEDVMALQAGVRKGFVSDAFLANWDAVGTGADNILITGTGKGMEFYRIDLGGSLLFRAQGGPKGAAFAGQVGELKTLLDASKNPYAAKWYGKVSDKMIYEQIIDLQSKLTVPRIAEFIKTSGLDPIFQSHMLDVLTQRLQYLDDYRLQLKASLKAAKSAPKVLPGSFTSISMDKVNSSSDIYLPYNIEKQIRDAIAGMSRVEQNSLSNYTGFSSGNYIYEAIKGTPNKDLVSAINKLPKIDAPLQRRVDTSSISKHWENWTSGAWDTVDFKGFTSAAYGEAYGTSKPVKYVILHKPGELDHGLIAQASDMPNEKEVIINARTQYRVLAYAEEHDIWGNQYRLVLKPVPWGTPKGSQPAPIQLTIAQVEMVQATGKMP